MWKPLMLMLSFSLKRLPDSLPCTRSPASLSFRLGSRVLKPEQAKQQFSLPAGSLHAPKASLYTPQASGAFHGLKLCVCRTRVTQESKHRVLTAHKALTHFVSSTDHAGARGACLLQRNAAAPSQNNFRWMSLYPTPVSARSLCLTLQRESLVLYGSITCV